MSMANIGREIIVAPPHAIVRASAGTGKTYRLAVRYLALLAAGADPSTILATTFTRKAAGEILQRVMGRLASAAMDTQGHACDVLTEDLRAELGLAASSSLRIDRTEALRLLRKLSRNLHRTSIGTIDSFLYRTAMSFRHELGLTRNIEPTDERDQDLEELREDAITAMIEGDSLQLLIDLLRRLLHDQAKRSVSSTLKQIVSDLGSIYAESPQAEPWHTLTVPPSPLADEPAIAAAVAQMDAIAAMMPSKSWAAAHMASREAAERRDWRAFLAKGIAAKLVEGETTFGRREIPLEMREVYQPLVQHARLDPVRRVAQQTRAMYALMQKFEAHFRPLQAERGLMLFEDFSRRLAAAQALDACPLEEMYYRLDGQIQHLLLDEFQDTSLAQWSVIEPLAAELTAHADGSRSFFCVGDVKQSIYAWRGGCPELFAQLPARLHLEDAPAQSLNTSYRSSPTITNTVNAVFGHLNQAGSFAEAYHEVVDTWQGWFEPHHAFHADLPGYAILAASPWTELSDLTSDAQRSEADENAEHDDDAVAEPNAHLRWCARQIAELSRQAAGRSIGVLARTNAVTGPLLDLLSRAGCEASGESGQSVTDDPAVNLVLSALRLAGHPGHTAAAYHVLHSPLAKPLGLVDLDAEHLEHVATTLRQQLLLDGYGAVITQWAQHLAPHGDQRSAVRLTQLVGLADANDGLSPLRPDAFIQSVENARVEEPTPAAVRVMTVHAAKGLEFDIVVLPQLDRPLPGYSETCWVVRNEPTGPVSEVHARADRLARGQSDQLKRAHQRHIAAQLREELSGLYVAMTRARQGLFMFVEPKKAKGNGQPSSRRGALSSLLIETLSTVEERAQCAQTFYESGDPHCLRVGPAIQSENANADAPRRTPQSTPNCAILRVDLPVPPRARTTQAAPPSAWRSWRRVSPSTLEAGARVRAAELLELDVSEARQRGRVIHAFFEQIGDLGDPDGCWGGLPTEDVLLTLAARIAPTQSAAWHKRQLEAFNAMLERADVRTCLTLPTPDGGIQLDLWRERSFAVRRDGQLLSGQFDRVLVGFDASGVARWAELIDFKTDRFDAGTQDASTSVARYQPQVEAYREALAVLLRLPREQVKAGLLFVEPGLKVKL